MFSEGCEIMSSNTRCEGAGHHVAVLQIMRTEWAGGPILMSFDYMST